MGGITKTNPDTGAQEPTGLWPRQAISVSDENEGCRLWNVDLVADLLLFNACEVNPNTNPNPDYATQSGLSSLQYERL